MKKIFYRILVIYGSVLMLQSCNAKKEENTGDLQFVKDSCCIKPEIEITEAAAVKSEITCPECGHTETETMPTDVCLLKYSCKKCNATLYPKEGDCCVFCTHGTHKCPSKQ